MTLYEVMGLHPNSTKEQIREKYLFLSKSFHPDRFQNEPESRKEAAAKAMQDVNAAYSILKDAKKRAAYDAQLIAERVKPFVKPAPRNTTGDGKGTQGLDLIGLASELGKRAGVKQDVLDFMTPIVDRFLSDNGIESKSATAEQILQSLGVFKTRRKRSA